MKLVSIFFTASAGYFRALAQRYKSMSEITPSLLEYFTSIVENTKNSTLCIGIFMPTPMLSPII
jgi:hypothetical protein